MKDIPCSWKCLIVCIVGGLSLAGSAYAGYTELNALQTPEGIRFKFVCDDPIEWSEVRAVHSIFIDADGRTDTGYREIEDSWAIGADYLIQNNRIHRYSGTSQQEWSWTMPAPLEYEVSGNSGWVFLPRALLRQLPLKTVQYFGRFDVSPNAPVFFPNDPERPVLAFEWDEPSAVPRESIVRWGPKTLEEIVDSTIVRPKGFPADSTEGISGLRNPERGFRLMDEIGCIHPSHVARQPRQLKASEEERFQDLTLRQSYCWLTTFADRPISEAKLARIGEDLEEARRLGRKLLLRFAYERSHTTNSYGPDWERIKQHMEQLAPIVHEFQDVIYILQSGFIGAYGEWHNSAEKLETQQETKEAYGHEFFHFFPSHTLTTIRIPRLKREILGFPDFKTYEWLNPKGAFGKNPQARIGFHNDGFGADFSDGGTWKESPLFGSPGNPEYDLMTAESLFVPVDGELFAYDQGGLVNGLWAANELYRHHYTSLGIWQGNAEIERPGSEFSINIWQRTQVTEDELRSLGLPISDNYFLNADGSRTSRNLFEYIRDHIGYRLEMQECEYIGSVKPEGELRLRLSLINRGFASPLLPRKVYVVLINQSGDVFQFPTEWDWRRWLPHEPRVTGVRPRILHTNEWNLKLPDYITPGRYRIGLWLPDASQNLRHDARFAVRFANDGIDWYEPLGINLLGELEVKRAEKPSNIAHWKFDNGRVNGNPYLETQPPGIRVARGESFNFNGRQPFTLVANIRVGKESPDGVLIARYNKMVEGQFYLALEKGIPVFGREVHPFVLKGERRLNEPGKYEIAATYDGRMASLFVNGDLTASSWMGPAADVPPSLPVTVGAGLLRNHPGSIFNGELLDIRVWDGAMVPEEWSEKN